MSDRFCSVSCVPGREKVHVSEAFKRLLQAIRFERDAFVWMDFNDRATGDALIFVVATTIGLLMASGNSLFGLVRSTTGINALFSTFLDAVIFWLLFAGIVLFVVRMLFQAPAKYPLLLRTVGFAYPTLLVRIFTSRLGLPTLVEFLLGAAWFLAIVTIGVRYESELSRERAAAAVGLAIVLWVIVSAILGPGLF